MLSSDNKERLYTLVRLGIGHQGGALPKVMDWNAIEALASAFCRSGGWRG